MKKLLLMPIIIFLSVLTIFAQNDKKAKDILDKLSNKYSKIECMKINFRMTVENNEEDMKDSSIGMADIKKKKYKISIMGTETFFDGKNRYNYMKDAEEVNISEIEENSGDLTNPAKIFDLYKNGFNYSLNKTYTKGNTMYAEIYLIPKEEKDFSKVIVSINLSKNEIVSFVSKGKEGNDLRIELIRMDTMVHFSDGHFVFDEKSHPNVEVVDMR